MIEWKIGAFQGARSEHIFTENKKCFRKIFKMQIKRDIFI